MRWLTTGESEKFRGNSNYQSILIRVLGSGGGCCVAAAAATLQSLRERKRKVTMSDT